MLTYIRGAYAWFRRSVLARAFAGDPPSPAEHRKMVHQLRREIRKVRAKRPIVLKIDKAVRNAVAVGFRRYSRLSAVARG